METVENKKNECEKVGQKKKNKWRFLIGMAVGVILYVTYQLVVK